MRILVIGPDRCGKTAVASYLGKILGTEVAETGHILMTRLAQFYARGNPKGPSIKTWAQTIYACKQEYRSELAALGDLLTEVSPTCLIDEAAKFGPIIVGMRRQRELQAYIRASPEHVRETILIRVRAPVYRDTGFELNGCPCDYEIRNDGSLNALQAHVESIARLIARQAA